MRDKKRLIIFAPSFYPNIGGVETHLLNVIQELKLAGWSPEVYVRYAPGYPKTQTVSGVKVNRMPKSGNIIAISTWVIKHAPLLISARAIHSHDYFPTNLRRLLPKKRWVHTFHGYEGFPINPDAVLSRQRVLGAVDFSFCVGAFIEKWYGTKCDKVIYGAARLSEMTVPIAIKYDYIFYGRLAQDTGVSEYLKAFRLIQQKIPTASMLIVGNGAKAATLHSYAKRNSLNTTFVDAVKDINPYLASAKVAFVSGYLAIIEAGLLKKPVVAYYGTPIKKDYLELHPMAHNFFVANSAERLASDSIKAILPANAKRVVNLYNWARQQTWENLANEYEKAYKN